MKFTANTKQFREEFQQAAVIVPSKATKEILKFVRVTYNGNDVRLTGTNGEISIERSVDCEAEPGRGELLIPANDHFRRWLGAVTGEELTIEGDEEKLKLRCGQAKSEMATANPADFPPVDVFEQTGMIGVVSGHLGEAFKQTVFATDVEGTRYALGGVHLAMVDGAIELAATDSRRLSVARIAGSIEGKIGNPVIPSAAIRAAMGMLGGPDELTIRVSANRVSIEMKGATITARLLEGRFPKYRDVIPKPANTATVNVGALLEACRISESFTDAETRAVNFRFAKGTLHVDAPGTERGKGDTSFPMQCDFEAAATFDPRFLIEALKLIPIEASIEWGITDSESPSMLTCGEWRYVVMPLSKDR